MGLSRQEIVDYASRYVEAKEIVDFPCEGDLFCLIGRDLPERKLLADEEGWIFQGYGICLGYTLDYEEKPEGKWLWMHFAGLASFPPSKQSFKLQPPHVVKGRFQNPQRTNESRIIKISLDTSWGAAATSPRSSACVSPGTAMAGPHTDTPDIDGKIVQFRPKKKP
jgi:hypothetical protein